MPKLPAYVIYMQEDIKRLKMKVADLERELHRRDPDAPRVICRENVGEIFTSIDLKSDFSESEHDFLSQLVNDAGISIAGDGTCTARRRLVLSPRQHAWLQRIRERYPRELPPLAAANEENEADDLRDMETIGRA